MNQSLYPITQRFLAWFSRPVLFAGLLLSIPAFYLLLATDNQHLVQIGHTLYLVAAGLIALDTYWKWKGNRRQPQRRSGKMLLDMGITLGCLISAIQFSVVWSPVEWLLRLGLCAAILLRIAMLVLQHMKPGHLVQIITLALLMLSSAGAGFYWLEPNVKNYADGVWLAFTTVATVGYGDIVPSTPSSKIFAVFIVLLGYAMFSIVTANIAALFVGEEEKIFERELHADIRLLNREIGALRDELRRRDKFLAELEHKVRSLQEKQH